MGTVKTKGEREDTAVMLVKHLEYTAKCTKPLQIYSPWSKGTLWFCGVNMETGVPQKNTMNYSNLTCKYTRKNRLVLSGLQLSLVQPIRNLVLSILHPKYGGTTSNLCIYTERVNRIIQYKLCYQHQVSFKFYLRLVFIYY